jgi:rod shape-determining protein MreD
MIYCAYIGISLCLVIIQTTVLLNLSPAGHFYDLLIPMLIYLALFRPSHESLPFVFFLGLLMDNLSGTPFGLYLTTYFWIYVGVKLVANYFRVGNRIMMALMVCFGVLIQNSLMVASALLMDSAWLPPSDAVAIISNQLFWALITGPLLLMLFRHSLGRLEQIIDQLIAKNQK